ncbi:MAG: class I SAM-dependent methyltransferase [Pirellulales bacterium]
MTVRPVFGGLRTEAARQAEEFSNRLRKRARHLRRWPQRRGITCYRLYDRDVPEVPLVIDRYADLLHIAEYDRPHDRTPAEHADWLDLMLETTGRVLDVPRGNIFFKRRERQRGTRQYQQMAEQGVTRIVEEAGLRFRINLTDYVDTGLFLDHRITRGLVRDLARGKRVLNLFAYTGSFSVYAAAGGAPSTTSVDLLPTHVDRARDNLTLNGFQTGRSHRLVQADARDYLAHLSPSSLFDLAVVDPPTFSNSKRASHDWDVQRDHADLLNQVASHLSTDGILFFSTNYRRFRLDEPGLVGLEIHEISRQTVPEDFRNRRVHRCWKLIRH